MVTKTAYTLSYSFEETLIVEAQYNLHITVKGMRTYDTTVEAMIFLMKVVHNTTLFV